MAELLILLLKRFFLSKMELWMAYILIISETRVMLKEIWLGVVFSMCNSLSRLQNIFDILDKHKKFISLKYPQDIHLVEILQ